MAKYEWLEKKRKLTVDNLRLWADNPRLNPEETHTTISDHAEDMVAESKDDFFELLKSIAESGFVPIDPVIVWKSKENSKYYVAEGNRRVVALKILRSPEKAPKSIRATVRRISEGIDKKEIEKIPVYIAPTFEDSEWYINQRNSTSSSQRRWSRVQQQRWIASLYEKYNGNINLLRSKTRLSNSELNDFIRILKIRDFLNVNLVKDKLTEEEYEKANSYKFPITILERFFASTDVRKKWGIKLDDTDVNILSNQVSFYNAFAELIKRIVNNENENLKIDTRTITSHLGEILKSLPSVSFEPNEDVENNSKVTEIPSIEENTTELNEEVKSVAGVRTLDDPKRKRLIWDEFHLHTDSTRLSGLFSEFKKMPLSKYPNTVAVSLRVFLDLAILNYIEREGLEQAIMGHYSRNSLKEIMLKKRLEYLKTHCLDTNRKKIAEKLLHVDSPYSLDVLNGFIHSSNNAFTSPDHLNRFWDFLFPLFNFLLDIRKDV